MTEGSLNLTTQAITLNIDCCVNSKTKNHITINCNPAWKEIE